MSLVKKSVISLLILLACSGCYSSVSLEVYPPEPTNSLLYSSFNKEFNAKPKYYAVLVKSRATFNGLTTNLNEGFRDRVAQLLRETGAFRGVYKDEQSSLSGPKLNIILEANESLDYNRLLNGIKGFIIGASFFVLSPVVPIYATFTSDLKVRIEKSDGSSRDYATRVTGESEHTIFKNDEFYPELTSKVTEEALSSLKRRITSDLVWLQK